MLLIFAVIWHTVGFVEMEEGLGGGDVARKTKSILLVGKFISLSGILRQLNLRVMARDGHPGIVW